MTIKTRLDIIKIDNGEVILNDALKHLAKLPVTDLVAFLKGPKLYARRDHATILKNVMKDEVWKFKLVSKVAEKGLANDFYSRLDYFEDSPVTVLENLFIKMVKIQPEMIDDYLEDMWLYALQVVKGKEKDLNELYRKALKSKTTKVVLKDLFPAINEVLGDYDADIDGVHVKTFKSKAMHAATIKELREIAERHHIDLPTNLTKQDIVDSIIAVLPKITKAKDLPHVTEDVKDMTIAQLKDFVAQNKLDVPTELRKVDLGELLIKNYVNHDGAKIENEPPFVLPERVDVREDFSNENPKFVRLNERVKELEKALDERAKEPAIVQKDGVDEELYLKEQEKSEALAEELKQARAELATKPKEVIVEVPGPTVVRTVVSKQALLKQKEKYEAIIAEQEKERALLISRVDEHDEVLAEYARVKAELAQKEMEQEEAPLPVKKEVEPVVEEPRSYGGLHEKVDRLVDKVHELQLEILRRDGGGPRRSNAHDDDRETEVNIYFDSNLAKRLAAQKDGTATEETKDKKKKRKKLPVWLRIIIWLLVITIVVFVVGWALFALNWAPFAGPPWLADPFNAFLKFLHDTVASFFALFV